MFETAASQQVLQPSESQRHRIPGPSEAIIHHYTPFPYREPLSTSIQYSVDNSAALSVAARPPRQIQPYLSKLLGSDADHSPLTLRKKIGSSEDASSFGL